MVLGRTHARHPNFLYWKNREAGEPIRVMVVDDDRLIADTFATLLNRNGYSAVPLYEASDAIDHARVIRFDLALLGVWMPGMDGVSAGILIRHLQRRCQVVLWVEDLPVELRTPAVKAGFAHISLPTPYDAFLRCVGELAPWP